MADLGAIGCLLGQKIGAAPVLQTVQILGLGANMVLGGKDTTEGSPAQPSLRMDAPGAIQFRVAVNSGARTVSVSVKQAANASPRPTMTVKASTGVLAAATTSTAGAGTGWVTLSCSFTALANGALWVELRNNLQRENSPCYWDHLQVS